jgi:hypothetical protein
MQNKSQPSYANSAVLQLMVKITFKFGGTTTGTVQNVMLIMRLVMITLQEQ